MNRPVNIMPPSPVQNEVVRAIEKKKRRRLITKFGVGAAGAALAGSILMNSDFHFSSDIKDIGFTPDPKVNSSQTDQLIGINDALNNHGWQIIGAEALLGLAYLSRRRQNPELEFHDKFAHQHNRWPAVLVAAGIVGTSATALGIGNTAADGAAEMIHTASAAFGVDEAATPIISKKGPAGNHISINYDVAAKAISEAGGIPMPMIIELGSVEDPKAANNPSSGPIVAIPNDVLKQSFGVDLPPVENCDDISVVVGEQLGVGKGSIVEIDGTPAHVKDTVPIKAGLGRVIAVGSVEQIDKCVDQNDKIAVARGLTIEQVQRDVLPKINEELQMNYRVRSFEDLVNENQKFWNGSVKPSQMNLIMYNLILGGACLGLYEGMQLKNRRKKIAERLSRDVSGWKIGAAEMAATQGDVLMGVAPGLLLYAALANVYSSSTWGIGESVNVGSLGGGATATAVTAGIASGITTFSMIRSTKKKLNDELRGA